MTLSHYAVNRFLEPITECASVSDDKEQMVRTEGLKATVYACTSCTLEPASSQNFALHLALAWLLALALLLAVAVMIRSSCEMLKLVNKLDLVELF